MTEASADVRTDRRVAHWTLAALFVMNLLNYVDRFILAAVLEPVQEGIGLAGLEDQDALAGTLATVFFVSYAVFSPVMGWLGDRVTRKYLLAVGVGVWSAATACSGLADTYREMLLARAVLGIGEATYATIAPSLIADLFPREQRNRALTLFYVAIPVGAALGYGIGGLVEAWIGWRATFFVVGLPGLTVALAALALREPRRGAADAANEQERLRHDALPMSWSIYATLARNRSYLLNTLGTAMFTFALGGLQFWAPKFLCAERGMTRHYADLGLGAVVVTSGLVGTPLGGWLADQLVKKWRSAYFWMPGLTMIASVPFITAALIVRSETLIFGCLLVGLTLCLMNYGPANTILVNVTLPKIRSAAFAVNIFFIHLLGDIPSPYLMGAVSDWTSNMLYGLAITLPALTAAGVLFCLGSRYLVQDEAAVLRQLHTAGISAEREDGG